MVNTLAVMHDFAGNPDFVEGVASFIAKRAPSFAALPASFRLLADAGYR